MEWSCTMTPRQAHETASSEPQTRDHECATERKSLPSKTVNSPASVTLPRRTVRVIRRVRAENATFHATRVTKSNPRRARRAKPSQERMESSSAPKSHQTDGRQNQETSNASRNKKLQFQL